jgi:hypothetical protein
MIWIGLTMLGLGVGALGTLVGAGGGFLLMPILALMYPNEEPESLACVSLAVVFLNALSGSIGYARQGLIDYRSGRVFLLAGVPGAILGALVTAAIPRPAFDLWLGGTLVLAALWILAAGGGRLHRTHRAHPPHHPRPAATPAHLARGAALSFGVGFLSSVLGIGGGIVHVPAMVYLLGFPVHVAAATSHFVLAGTALSGTLVHLISGSFTHGYALAASLGVGVVIGAQIGSRLARRTPSAWIMRVLAVALAGVGMRVVMLALRQMPG